MAKHYSSPKAGDIVFGVHPKRGKLNLDDNDLKRRLSSAIAELKQAGRPKAVDMITRSAGRKKPKL